MSRPWIFVSPASRGIGYALTRHLLRTTHPSIPILATARSDPEDLRTRLLNGIPDSQSDTNHPPRLTVLPLDVTDEGSIASAAQHASKLFPSSGNHLHLGFAIPGILTRAEKNISQIDAALARQMFEVNALGPLMLMKHFSAFLPRRSTQIAPPPASSHEVTTSLPAHALWLAMSARVGSITDNKLGGWYSYRASKAAVNQLVRTLNRELATRSGGKAMCVAYHPGTVKTGLSKAFWASAEKDAERKLLEPEEAVEHMVRVVTESLGTEDGGACWDWKGEKVPP